jgi:proteic killer suppression protein
VAKRWQSQGPETVLVARCATRYKAGIHPHHAKRLRMQLVALDTAYVIDDMFEFREGHAYVLDYEDYH